jgi:hypothetical protein
MNRCTRPAALGYLGIAGIQYLGADRAKVTQQDVCCIVGPVHSEWSYICQPSIMRKTWNALTAEQLPVGVTKSKPPAVKSLAKAVQKPAQPVAK